MGRSLPAALRPLKSRGLGLRIGVVRIPQRGAADLPTMRRATRPVRQADLVAQTP